ncbi:hypothetical protein ACIQVC_37400 [Streptomyces sp. NPDC101112]|uniref:hypothetical protein n=1 Tax=Streptomyces sp. NPDC101112 TaxID=3366105 RepID=UPI0037FE4308
MPRIKVLEAIAGADFSWAPGDVVDVSEEEAASWADGHRATLLLDDEGSERIQDLVYGEAGLSTPRVVTEDGVELNVLSAEFEDDDPPAETEGGRRRQRMKVVVALLAEDAPQPAEETGPDDEEKEPEVQAFDPREHTNREVLAYLENVGYEEALRVLDLEASKEEPRAGIVKNREQLLEAARTRHGGQADAEKAADSSRGGGRAEQAETRSW